MSETTIFEKIVAGEIPSTKIYEDEHTLAFLDIQPNNLGHTLVITKQPYKNLYEIPEDLIGPLFQTVQKIACAVKQGLGAEGINIRMNNDAPAGQDVFHAHVHVIPRYTDDGFQNGRHLAYDNPEHKESIAQKIRAAL